MERNNHPRQHEVERLLKESRAQLEIILNLMNESPACLGRVQYHLQSAARYLDEAQELNAPHCSLASGASCAGHPLCSQARERAA